jgi:hypothetical protein
MKCEKCDKNADAGNGLCLNCYSKILGNQRNSAKAQGADEFEQSEILFGSEE